MTPSRLEHNGQLQGHWDNDLEMVSAGDATRRLSGNASGVEELQLGDESDSDNEFEGGETALLGRKRDTGLCHSTSADRTKPRLLALVVESMTTLVITAMGLLLTGELLDKVSRWPPMLQLDQLIIILPVILNLKGNLEMNLSARLGTIANTGGLDDPKERRSVILGNLTLLQVQGFVVAFFAACLSLVLGSFVPLPPSSETSDVVHNVTSAIVVRAASSSTIKNRSDLPPPVGGGEGHSGLVKFALVASIAVTATALSGFLLDSFICGLVVLCRKFNRDPDNIAPAIASCFGDFLTLSIIGTLAIVLTPCINTVIPLIVGIFTITMWAGFLVLTLRNNHVRPLLSQGWTPLFGAMIISCGTGIVLDMFVHRYQGFAILAVVMNGLPGAAGSIFISRLSTALHATKIWSPAISSSTCHIKANSSQVMLALFAVTVPVDILFISIIHVFGWVHLPFLFVLFSIVFFCCGVTISLVVAEKLTNFLWSKNYDPDVYALPIHSALVDLVDQVLLVLCFEIVAGLGSQVGVQA